MWWTCEGNIMWHDEDFVIIYSYLKYSWPEVYTICMCKPNMLCKAGDKV